MTAAIAIAVLGGCSVTKEPVTYLGHSDLQYYKGLVSKIDYPNKSEGDNPAAFATEEPRRIRHLQKDQIWDMSLAEAVHIALKNNKIIRAREQLSLPRNPLIQNPDQSPSVFDPALQETGVLFGQRGVEAALSDFDAQFSANMSWGHNAQVENNQGVTAVPIINGLPTLIEDTATFRARLDKQFADSGQFSLIQEWDYVLNNVTGNLFPSVYTGFVRAEYRRPLLAGAGTDYTRVAGPIGKNTPGVAQGVVISRINNDIAIADFESSVHTLLRDVQQMYWDLSLAYHTYHTEKVNRENVLNVWRLVQTREKKGLEGGSAPDETQAREGFFDAQGRTQEALGNLYTVEEQFRRLLGLPVNDGRVIRPSDEPSVAEFIPDWHIALAQGITRRPEIRKQKWNIKSLELQLAASKSLILPRVDFVAGGQINAFGNELISDQSTLNESGSSAFASLVEAGQTSWNIGFEASIPIGFRNAHAQVRNDELRVARARAGLATQELDVSHEIAEAFQALDRAYSAAQTAFNRRAAAAERVDAYKAEYQLKATVVDPLLRAQQALGLAEVSYYQAVAQYNQAVTNFYYRTGTILDESNVSIAEDMWDPHAYSDALREAWARSHALPNPLLHTEPPEFVVPPGRPTSTVPLVPSSGAPVFPSQAQAEPPASAGPASPAGTMSPGSQPAAPPPLQQTIPQTAPPNGPSGGPSSLPQAQAANPTYFGSILPVSAESENFISPVTGAVIAPVTSPVTTAVGRMESLVAPVPLLANPASSGTAESGQPAMSPSPALAPPLPQAQPQPEFLAPVGVSPPALQSSGTSWSAPQAAPGPSNSIDEVRGATGEQYDMPLNQLRQ